MVPWFQLGFKKYTFDRKRSFRNLISSGHLCGPNFFLNLNHLTPWRSGPLCAFLHLFLIVFHSLSTCLQSWIDPTLDWKYRQPHAVPFPACFNSTSSSFFLKSVRKQVPKSLLRNVTLKNISKLVYKVEKHLSCMEIKKMTQRSPHGQNSLTSMTAEGTFCPKVVLEILLLLSVKPWEQTLMSVAQIRSECFC